MTIRDHIAVLLLSLMLPTAASPASLNIRVLEGENATNNVLTHKAIEPVVEVRDGEQPVMGAKVTFELPGYGAGGSFHGWMRAETLTTDAAGRVAASDYEPNRETGHFEIRATAVSGSDRAETTIAQTNGPAVEARDGTPLQRASRRRTTLLLASLGLSIFVVAETLHQKQNVFSWVGIAGAIGMALGAIATMTKHHTGPEKIVSAAGRIEITPIRHAALMLRAGGAVVYIDPVGVGNYQGRPKADVVLVTDNYPDHLDAAAVASLSKPGTVIYGPEAAEERLPHLTAIRNGEKRIFRQWEIEAVPAYNLPPADMHGKVFHENGLGNGYLLRFGGKEIYISGNTGSTPEMKALRGVDVAFLAMSPPYTMTADEAALAVRTFHPGIVYPYDYRGNVLSVFRFRNDLAGTGVDVRVRNWYP